MRVLFIVWVCLAALAAACGGDPAEGQPVGYPSAGDEQRAGASGLTTIRPTIIDRADWVDECQHLMEYKSLVKGDDYADIYSWQITAMEILAAEQLGRGYQWRLVQAPEGATGLLSQSQESIAWLCGPAGEYQIEVTTYLGDSRTAYTMQAELRQP